MPYLVSVFHGDQPTWNNRKNNLYDSEKNLREEKSGAPFFADGDPRAFEIHFEILFKKKAVIMTMSVPMVIVRSSFHACF